jgi:2-polyprenyl-6-methoxyphenol hydroxylase-like FAD-dependent oxidoreductase
VIIGGGIAGAVSAIALQRAGISSTIAKPQALAWLYEHPIDWEQRVQPVAPPAPVSS